MLEKLLLIRARKGDVLFMRWRLMKLSYVPLQLVLTTECKILYFRLQILYCLTTYGSFYLYKCPWSLVPGVTHKIPEYNYTLFEKYYLVANFNFSFNEQALHSYLRNREYNFLMHLLSAIHYTVCFYYILSYSLLV